MPWSWPQHFSPSHFHQEKQLAPCLKAMILLEHSGQQLERYPLPAHFAEGKAISVSLEGMASTRGPTSSRRGHSNTAPASNDGARNCPPWQKHQWASLADPWAKGDDLGWGSSDRLGRLKTWSVDDYSEQTPLRKEVSSNHHQSRSVPWGGLLKYAESIWSTSPKNHHGGKQQAY